MSTYIDVYIDDHFMCGIRNPIDLSFIQAFRLDELRVVRRTDHERRHLHDESEAEVPELATRVGVLRDRLATMGFGGRAPVAVAKEHVEERLSWMAERATGDGQHQELVELFAAERQELLTFDSARWCRELEVAVQRCLSGETLDDAQKGVDALLDFSEFADPRFVLRALVDCVEDGEIALDLYEFLWEFDQDDLYSAAQRLFEDFGEPDPPVLLTEGRTDMCAISKAIEVLAPHLDGYIRFFDYEARPEGGASALTRFVRAFAAAGIKNRVVAIFDNDTAGAEQLELLKSSALPANIRAHRLPYLPNAEEYPTRGPTGLEIMDVNESAASIELYLGTDVLQDDTGNLRPVQWAGYNSKMDRYQGEVIGKKQVLAAFEAKAERASGSAEVRSTQDWAGMSLVLDSILEWLADIPPYWP